MPPVVDDVTRSDSRRLGANGAGYDRSYSIALPQDADVIQAIEQRDDEGITDVFGRRRQKGVIKSRCFARNPEHIDWLNKTLVYVPVYSAIAGTGTNVSYTLLGFAAFVITGYHISGNSFSQADWLNQANDCHGPTFCIDGYFTQGLIPSTGGLGGKGLGASIVKLTG